jgi:hypothetical protein
MACRGTALLYFLPFHYCFIVCNTRKLLVSNYRGRGADNPTLENTLVTKSEEAIAGYFCWQKLLRKARAHVGLSSQ